MTRCDLAVVALLVGAPLLLAGCGGTSQDDMMRHAIRRTPDKDEEDQEDAAPAVAANDRTEATETKGPTAAATVAKAGNGSGDEVATKPATKAPPVARTQSPPEATAATAPPTAETLTQADPVAAQSGEVAAAATTVEPLSPAEARSRTAENLKAISQAWQSYLRERTYVPGPITSPGKEPLLSWRVELLPYLGLQPLYEEFHLDEAWDSPHNSKLLAKIPAVYQSPERRDTKTNYLALDQGTSTIYQVQRKVSERIVEDGIENTLAVVEIDDEGAVEWTRPAEYEVQPRQPLKLLGKLRANGFFAVWGDGKPTWIASSIDASQFTKACSIDAGDGFRRGEIAGDLAAGIAIPADPASDAPPSETVASTSMDDAAETEAIEVAPRRPTLSDAQAALKSKQEGSTAPPSQRQPIPSGAELKVSRDLLRELYQSDYAAATSTSQRVQLARKMLGRLSDLGTDTAGQYALLEIAKQIAVQAGDVELALDAADQLLVRFELEGGHLFETFEKVARTANDQRSRNRLLDEAERFFDELVYDEEFSAAERLSQLAIATANKLNDQAALDKFTSRRSWANAANDLSKAAEEGLVALETNPEDPRANGEVGKFLCLVKGDWDNGLVILANGNDRSLKRLAEMELSDAKDAMQQLELADLWWRESETELPAFRTTLKSRAKYWYERSLSGLPAGLVRIRVERRIEEIDKQSA